MDRLMCLLLALAVSGCAAGLQDAGVAATVSSPSLAGSLTPALTPTSEAATAASPRPTATIAPTPTTALGDVRYYLVYSRRTTDGAELVLADAGGPGRRGWLIAGMSGGWGLDLAGVSPSGEYLAYHTGEVAEKAGDLTLQILRLADGVVVKRIPLVTDDLGEQMRGLGEQLAASPPDGMDDAYWTEEEFAEAGMFALESGIGSVAWSPDGSELAFAGQIDGPSSDVYVYDPEEDEIRRLTDGPTQVQYLDWSPDGRWIAHGSAYWTGAGPYMINNFVKRDGSASFSLDIGGQYGNEWYGSTVYLANNGANGPGSYDLMSISMDRQQARTLWPYPLSGYALDIRRGRLLVQTLEYLDDGQGNPIGYEPGIYLVDLVEGTVELLKEDVDFGEWFSAGVRPWPKAGEFALVSLEGNVYGMNEAGGLRLLLENEAGEPYPSPDGNRIAFFGYNDREGMRIFDVLWGGLVTLPESPTECASWRPDGEAVVFVANDVLYFNNLTGAGSVIVDGNYQYGLPGCEVRWVEDGQE